MSVRTAMAYLGLLASFAVNADKPVYRYFELGDKAFRAIRVDPAKVSLHWKGADNRSYCSMGNLKYDLEEQGKTVNVMMNAGIYGSNNTPAGLHIERGKSLNGLNTRHGRGNFHIQPNGVFLINRANRAKIVTTGTYNRYFNKNKTVRLATQSGPMLLINGKINRQFIKNGKSEYTRNGVCTTQKGQLYFFATETFPTTKSNLYLFAKAAQKLGCYQALYLDGNISKLYIKGRDSTFHFGDFVGILAVED
ncbi:MAG: hypothetical protein CSA45_04480 [Gammaproteobacteria bacterium]|nr:MAG: hypothetical protein CSA45_04480 [Gammaproteobacteria bacterium]